MFFFWESHIIKDSKKLWDTGPKKHFFWGSLIHEKIMRCQKIRNFRVTCDWAGTYMVRGSVLEFLGVCVCVCVSVCVCVCLSRKKINDFSHIFGNYVIFLTSCIFGQENT